MLKKYNVPLSLVDVFVADEEEAMKYSGPYNVIVGVPGIHRQREFIHEYYPEGQRLLCIDDDVTDVKSIYGKPVFEYIPRMFEIMEKEKINLAGVYPTDDGRCLKDEAAKGLYYIIGSFFLMINQKGYAYPHATTEDFTRTILSYRREGSVLRFSGFGIKTTYFTEAGGLQAYRTADNQKREMDYLVQTYPEHVTLRQKPGKLVDAVFKRKPSVKIEKPFQEP